MTPASNLAPVAVIGMHRSGTSCLAGCLEDLGLHLGAVNTAAPHNKKGNRENPRFWPVHDAVLARVGAAWDAPPNAPVAWTASEIADLKAVLSDYDTLPTPWGFKDPRATLLLDGWFEVLPDLKLVASIRHPLAVAGSLAARNGFDQDRSLAIWTGYNRAVLRWRDLTPFSVIDYDADDYEARIRHVARGLGLNAAAPMPFRSDELNHQKINAAVPASVADLWAALRDAAR
ncbi:hypothetical protein [Brevundimonas vesicularis]|uniref:hypothetical protein n=1 Tax=Brevundimonas vesicularis TaxID=41276 RepID=UPI0028AB8B07|nr:hypothetical protein [Brevundimonas vesicularis]